MQTIIMLPWAANSRPPWVARVVGVDKEYGWQREWVTPGVARPGGAVPFLIQTDGFYEAETAQHENTHRFFFKCVTGEVSAISSEEWYVALKDLYAGYPFSVVSNVVGTYWLDGRYGVSDSVVVGGSTWTVLVVLERRNVNGKLFTLVVAAPRQPSH